MESHLLQMRGLKQRSDEQKYPQYLVASFTDAWIETFLGRCSGLYVSVASFTDAWIETLPNSGAFSKERVASFTDAWIETSIAHLCTGARLSHLLQMRGLKLF